MKIKKYKFLVIAILIIISGILISKISIGVENCHCRTEGFQYNQDFTISNWNEAELSNAKVLVFQKGSNFKKIIERTHFITHIDEIDKTCSVAFAKPITTNADWEISSKGKKTIKITDIKTDAVELRTMFSSIYLCEIVSFKNSSEKISF